MRNSLKVFLAGFFLLLFFVPALSAFQVPSKPDGYVTDRAGLLSPYARADLEAKLRSFEQQTSNQLMVATFPSLEGESIEDVSMRIAEAWKPGQKGKDNGVILLIFKNDRKIRIEVGYGLEGVLPDALAGQIIRNEIAPEFKQGHYADGIFGGVAAIMAATRSEYTGSSRKVDWFLLLIIIFILLTFFIRFNSGRGVGYRSGGFRSGGFSGGGFSGGGGGFGGGGASGGW